MSEFQNISSSVDAEEQIAKMSEIHHFSSTELDHLKILRQGSPDDKMLKTFRDLRAQLVAKAGDKNYSCLFTSVCPKGGASHVCRNLAAAIALDRTKTAAIVDCDFYSPSVGKLLSAEINVGLADYLNSKNMGLEYIVYASGISRVRVIPAGNDSESSAERLSSVRMKTFLRELKSRYPDRFVLVDAPPVLEFPADVRALSQMCDFVVLVVPYGMVTQEQIASSVAAIGEDKLAGVVFNSI